MSAPQVTSSSNQTPAQVVILAPELKTRERLSDILRNRVIFFTGYPGSGKGTQGKMLADAWQIRHLSTGELFRAEAEKKSEIGLKMEHYMKLGQVIPKELTFDYLKQELSKPEYREGFILDGYPKNKESYDFIIATLKELQFEPLAAMHFDISREKVLERLTGRRHCVQCKHDFHVIYLPPKVENSCDHCSIPLEQRKDDTQAAIEKRLNVFEENTSPIINQFADKGLLIRMEAAKSPTEVYHDVVRTILEISLRQITLGGSYFLRLPQKELSSVFHNHIDAKSHELLRSIVHRVEAVNLSFQNKIYPVSYLKLGPQIHDEQFSSVYQCLPNFHPIDNASDEAFSTGKMGDDGFNYDQIRQTLEIAFQHPNEGVMTELEEDIFGMEFDTQGRGYTVLYRGNTHYAIDWEQLPGWKDKMIPNVPRFELHHGFDLTKSNEETTPPINLNELSEKTTQLGFLTGGWFIFRKDNQWSYRSNEFSNLEYGTALQKLIKQASFLRNIFEELIPEREVTSSCSLEKVHAMWRV